METVASNLAEHLKTRVTSLRSRGEAGRSRIARFSRVGDIVDMLKLPAGQRLYPPETVTIHRVLRPTRGRTWQPSAEADVLLLGDSFSNIYGTRRPRAGERPRVPCSAFAVSGPRCRRDRPQRLRRIGDPRELARRPEPLAGKTVVVWEFAARELMMANWEVVPMPATRAEPPAANLLEAQPDQLVPLVLEATVVATSRVPAPFAVPYKDCLTYVKLQWTGSLKGPARTIMSSPFSGE